MGAVKRFPYPKEVWSPAGGWWTRPANWKSNTVIVAAGMSVIIAVVWKISAEREWSKQFTDGEYKELKFAENEKEK
ncbi:2746_t:CDS:2 [Diversispora eburnea]|uniref:2746_t:CDS:1 n=1 Tax=Diversispora eburnea TaxID=1213867 RepID=A0A9N8V8Z6_9GLOM|nr:2746_t:CDS:2 [Diversispora eburnea]